MKRLLDIVGAIIGLLLLSPLILILAVLVRWKLGLPVFFRQVRAGWKGKPFLIIKFRSMTDQRDKEGELLPDAERMTPFCRFLRSTSLDEIPELINVLKGKMSFVGPRPLLVEYLDLYTPEQVRRHEVKPGITGWAQVNGRNALSWEDRFRLDTWYVDHRSFRLDCKIILITIARVITRKEITADEHVSMPKFTGK